jgi:hypothetical protein
MKHIEILEKNFNNGMKGVRYGATFDKFKRTHPSLLKVILDSMADIERTTNANNLVINRTSTEPKFK